MKLWGIGGHRAYCDNDHIEAMGLGEPVSWINACNVGSTHAGMRFVETFSTDQSHWFDIYI